MRRFAGLQAKTIHVQGLNFPYLTGKYSLDVQVENLRAFLQSMGLRRVHLGGSSMGGGGVALYAAAGEVSRSDLMKHYDATSEFPLLVQTHTQQLTNSRNHAR